ISNGTSPIFINRGAGLGSVLAGNSATFTFTATNTQCCVAPNFTWSLVSGTLPPGMLLTNNLSVGTLSGVPTTPGTYVFVLRALDTVSGNSAARQFTLNVTT